MQETTVNSTKDDNPFASMLSELGNASRAAQSRSQAPSHARIPSKRRWFGFATPLHGRHRWHSVLRSCLLLLLCGISVFVIHRVSRAWLISRLSENLAAHPHHVQLERLGMLSEFGTDAIPAILKTLAEKDTDLSLAGYQTLIEMQGRWQTVGGKSAQASEHAMMDAIASLIPNCPPQRRPWLTNLLNQTLLATVEQADDSSRACYERANQLLETLSPGAFAGDAFLSPRIARQVLTTQQRPDPASFGEETEGEAYPARQLVPLPTRVSAAEIQGTPTPVNSANEPDYQSPSAGEASPNQGPDATPIALRIVPRSLEPFAPSRPEAGSDERNINADGTGQNGLQPEFDSEETQIGPPSLSEAPLAVYDVRSVIGLLNSDDKTLQNHAIQELHRRNMSDAELTLAYQLVSPDIEVRRALAESLVQRSDIDPRPWLLWLAEDASRDIRLEAISRLGAMDDRGIQTSLRTLLADERDTVVAARIRRILGLR